MGRCARDDVGRLVIKVQEIDGKLRPSAVPSQTGEGENRFRNLDFCLCQDVRVSQLLGKSIPSPDLAGMTGI